MILYILHFQNDKIVEMENRVVAASVEEDEGQV